MVGYLEKLVSDPGFSSQDYYIALPYHYLRPISEKFSYPNLFFGSNSMNNAMPAIVTTKVRNAGIPLDLDLVRDQRANRSAIERRAATLGKRRSIKKQWQAA
ncbi:MAG: hypothetical protein ACE5GN_06090, partial [Waddliaceae bacterium]